ncbi:MAG TPA: cation transporter [Holophagaceae bacterium]|nr:cation transporter [Holophagaceae bacterium]
MMKLKIQGMTCGHCVHSVTQALEAVPGVTKVVEVSLKKGEALLEGDPDPKAAVAAVAEEGYTAEVLR